MAKLEKTYRQMILEGRKLRKEQDDNLDMMNKDKEIVKEGEEAEDQNKQKMGATPEKPSSAANRPADDSSKGLKEGDAETEKDMKNPADEKDKKEVVAEANLPPSANRPADNKQQGLKEKCKLKEADGEKPGDAAMDKEPDADPDDKLKEAEELTQDPVVKARQEGGDGSDGVPSKADTQGKKIQEAEAEAAAADAKDDKEMKDKLAENTKTAIRQMGNLLEDHGGLEAGHKDQVKTLFEAALSDRTKIIRESLQEQFDKKLTRAIETSEDSLIESLDRYLDKVVANWLQENRLAVETGVRAEITESFLGAMKAVFEDHYVDVPDEKLNIVESIVAENEEMEAKLNAALQEKLTVEEQLTAFRKAEVLETLAEGMTLTEKERLAELTEEISFTDKPTFMKKAKTIKENFLRKSPAGDAEILNEDAHAEDTRKAPVSAIEQRYGRVLSRLSENKFNVNANPADK